MRTFGEWSSICGGKEATQAYGIPRAVAILIAQSRDRRRGHRMHRMDFSRHVVGVPLLVIHPNARIANRSARRKHLFEFFDELGVPRVADLHEHGIDRDDCSYAQIETAAHHDRAAPRMADQYIGAGRGRDVAEICHAAVERHWTRYCRAVAMTTLIVGHDLITVRETLR